MSSDPRVVDMPLPRPATAVAPDRATRAYQDFLLGAKRFWSGRLYRALHQEFRRREAGRDAPVEDFAQAEAMIDGVLYGYFGWFERHLQRLKYADPRHGLLAAAERQRGELERALAEVADGEHLRLDESLEAPRYYTAVDFHQHPGGVAGDPLAGFVYEYGRRTTTPAHAHEDDLHFRLVDATPRRAYRRILDFGCGVGKSTYPFKQRYPDAEVHGCDISAPCLKLAHLRAREAGHEIFYAQQNMERTDYPDGHFDLVHTTFIQHEFPPPALEKITREAFRLLRPGGLYVNLDFHSAPGGAFGRLCYFGHARRNNEVFMRAFHDSDYLGLLREVGFRSAGMLPFDDGTGPVAQDEVPSQWRFPWQLFISEK